MSETNNIRKKSFTFNGIDFHKHRWFICTIGSNTDFDFGINREVEFADYEKHPMIVGVKDTPATIPITFIQSGYETCPLKVSRKKYDELCRMLYTNEPKSLEVGGMTYIGVFTNLGKGYDNGANGYITLNFQLSTPYITANKIMYEINRITNSKNIKINNISTANGYDVYPQIYFKNRGNSLRILNKSNGSKLELSNLKNNNDYVIFGEQKQVFNNNNVREIIYCNNFITLNYGINNLFIQGTGDIIIQFRPKMGLTPNI